MKSSVLALALALSAAGTACAQQPAQQQPAPQAQQDRGPGGRRGNPTQFLLRGITLSAAQQAKVDSLGAQWRAQFEAERGQRGQDQSAQPQDRAAMRAQFEQRREQMNAQIRAILTPDQQSQFDKNVADMKARMQQRGQRGQRSGE